MVKDKVNSFCDIEVSPEWCFNNVRSTERWTHGYHRYPAKFLPNLVSKLIEEYTNQDDIVADLFAGCGTTLVEAKIHGRKSVGVDINPVAELITKVKTRQIPDNIIQEEYEKLKKRIVQFDLENVEDIQKHERIDYWFFPESKAKIAFLYRIIGEIPSESVRDFFLCALSNILKNCSRWLQSSTKPQLDKDKKPTEVFLAFGLQVKMMVRKNLEFFKELEKNQFLDISCQIKLEDARKTSINDESVTAVITSPPYVTSYEYADIHQLTAYWFDYISDLPQFRKNFIGTFYSLNKEIHTHTPTGKEIVEELSSANHSRISKEVSNYFNDMLDVGSEMKRILKPGGYACIVIGNTTYREIKIKSSEVFAESLIGIGFELVEVIKRSIPYKLIPSIRDKKTGRFTKLESQNSKLVYPEEYIIIAKKL